jgi:hypothetical protein
MVSQSLENLSLTKRKMQCNYGWREKEGSALLCETHTLTPPEEIL